MLRTLAIRDFVIVDHLELEFTTGFTVLTGETGAGKSILIDALSLILGARGDASMVREGAAKADISGEFQSSPAADQWLREQDLYQEESGLLLRRTLDNAGRSKAWINGIAATVAQLRELADMLVDIHGQHAHQSLLRQDAQRQLLDSQGGLTPLLADLQNSFKNWRTLKRQREEFELNTKNILQERERLEWQVGELEKLQVKPGEWESVSQQHSKLAHAASLLEAAQEAAALISESDHPLLSQLHAMQQKLSRLQSYDAALKPVCDALESASIHLQETSYALNVYLDRTELDPDRLRELEQRVEVLHSTARRFHVAPEDLYQEWQNLAGQLQQLGDASDVDALRAQEEKAAAAYFVLADKLSQARTQVAGQLARAVTTAMQDLSMAGGSFAIELHRCEASAHGLEQIEFMVAGHAGVQPRALAKVASGGELARISLAISVIASSAASTPTLIFDEVDSGIGGGVAEIVGKLLKRLGQQRQVLCVTHLPQVASQANQHFQVSKQQSEGKTVSSITRLDQKQRVEEIARMLGGLEITATTRKHARELLAL